MIRINRAFEKGEIRVSKIINYSDLRKCAEIIKANMPNENTINTELGEILETDFASDVIKAKTAELKDALEKYMLLSEEYTRIIYEVEQMMMECDYGAPRPAFFD